MAGAEELEQLGYDDVRLVGRGGFGAVYSALDAAFGRRVAVKLLSTELDDEANHRFERERRALAALPPHPHIVTVHAVARTSTGRPFLVMELAEGGALRQQVGQLSWTEAFTLGVQLAGALETAHLAGVIHRDVKPENVLLGRYGEAKLSDFGIARLEGGSATATSALTATLSHVAPEILGGAAAAPTSDVYSLASTLHTLVAGSPPFVAGDGGLPQLIARISSDEAPSLTSVGVPTAAAAVISRALSKRPDDRPSSAAAFGEELAEALRSAGVAAPAMAVPAPLPVPAEADEQTDLTSNATVMGRRGPAPVPVAETTRRPAPARRSALLVGAAAVAVGLAVVGVAQPWKSDAHPVASQRAVLPSPSASATPSTRPVASATPPSPTAPAPGRSAAPLTTLPGNGGQIVSQPTSAAVGSRGTTAATSTPTANHPPTLQSVPAQTSNELTSPSLHLTGRDADGDRLTYSLGSALPAGLSLNRTTGVIGGTVRATASTATSSYGSIRSTALRVVVRVSDGKLTATQSFTWTVRDTAFVMPNYFNSYGCGSTCSPPAASDSGKPSIKALGPFDTVCTDTKPSGITDSDKIYSQSVAPGSSTAWGTKITYGYYPCRP